MSKSNKYYLNNPKKLSVPSLRDELHRKLAETQFIEEVTNDQIEVEEKNSDAKLKKVSIEELNYSDDKSKVDRIWKINLEKEIFGISTKDKTPECAILVLQKYESSYKLNIILIELKSSISNKDLGKIGEKFQCAMSRIYMLLVLNNHLNSIQNYHESEIYIDFKGILFYQNFSDKSKFTEKNNEKLYSQMYDILQTPGKSRLFTCQTILKDQDKINIKCFCQQDEVIKISLESLLSK
ncbi:MULTISPECIES: hypothetical protein [Nostocales]|jgi:hypothetical protein|uniref:Uncharacterized protein n=1 Tax=Dolichospermum flos-aquae UHCC 0037 TaxID=2590026 RepID=A0ACC7S9Q1_DOLFA|nr:MULTISPECIES: hypothetical protein [Nostocales]MBO1066464.1 hypothetical protein [Anabaena sp. 54]MTJ45248.1 hypothetical protein [Dolichospermum flos-aquae UHCC 0037]QSV71815.1 MAG: hypothetical protein HEQ20_15030 [Aphanizomenon flos-aquae KM1D3_PB]